MQAGDLKVEVGQCAPRPTVQKDDLASRWSCRSLGPHDEMMPVIGNDFRAFWCNMLSGRVRWMESQGRGRDQDMECCHEPR